MELKSLFTFENFVKFAVLYAGLIKGYYDIKQEIRDNKVNYLSDKAIIEFRVANLEKALSLDFAGSNKFAILPNKPERKEYE